MKHTRTVSIVAATGLLCSVAFTAAQGSISAQENLQYPGGSVVFELGGDGIPQVALYNASGQEVDSIDLDVTKKCVVTNLHTPADPPAGQRYVDEYLDISIDGDPSIPVLLVENGLGTGTQLNCRSGNGRLSDGQTLTIARGTAVAAAGQSFLTTNVNAEGKFSANLLWATDDPDGSILAGDPGVNVYNLVNASDNGSDSGGNDNDMAPIDNGGAPFDSLSVGPTSSDGRGQIAVDDGGDTGLQSATRTEFVLGADYDYDVNCGDTISKPGTPFPETDPPTDTTNSILSVSVERLQNLPRGDATGYGACDKIGVDINFFNDLDVGGEVRDVAEILNSFTTADGTRQAVRARVEIVWAVERLNGDGSLRTKASLDTELDREIQYPGESPQPIPYCAALVASDGYPTSDPNDTDGYDTTDPDVAIHPAATDEYGRPDGEPSWCMLSDSRELSGSQIIQTVVFDASGDPRFF